MNTVENNNPNFTHPFAEGQGFTPHPQQTRPINPLLQRIQLPGETFTLPSGGIFYTDGELDSSVENGEIHVHPMTTFDEIMLKTPDMLFSGNAVRQVFARCIPQVLNTDRLLAKDVDFLLTCLRKVSYGNELRVEYTHSCENAKSHTYTVDVGDFIRKSKKIDPTTLHSMFVLNMPNGQKVLLQPIRYKEFVRILQSFNIEDDTSVEKVHNAVVDSISSIINQVDDVRDPNMIREWVSQVPPMFISEINSHVDKTVDWGPSFKFDTKCKDCGEVITIDAPLNPLAFFT